MSNANKIKSAINNFKNELKDIKCIVCNKLMDLYEDERYLTGRCRHNKNAITYDIIFEFDRTNIIGCSEELLFLDNKFSGHYKFINDGDGWYASVYNSINDLEKFFNNKTSTKEILDAYDKYLKWSVIK